MTTIPIPRRAARSGRQRLAAALLAAALLHAAGARAGVSGDIAADAVWDGTVEVDGVVRVAEGATLLVRPGTTVRFAPGLDEAGQHRSRLVVAGTLVAQGAADAPVRFISAAATPQKGDWGGISLDGARARPSRLSHAVILNAADAVTGAKSVLFAEDVRIEGSVRGFVSLQDFRGRLLRGSLVGNDLGLTFFQNSSFAVEDTQISGGTIGGIECLRGSSPAIRSCTILDNGTRGITAFQGSSPLIEGNTIRGHEVGVFLQLQCRSRILRNAISGNGTGIWGEKFVFAEIAGNEITANGTGIYCNYSAYPTIHGNNIHGNAGFGLVLGDNMSIVMEKRIAFRMGGQFSLDVPPEPQFLPPQTRKLQALPQIEEGVVDARGNWWGADAVAEMARIGPEGNSAAIEDFFDKPDTWYEDAVFRRDRAAFAPWEAQPVAETGPPARSVPGVRGKVVFAGQPAGGVRVHVYTDAAGGFRGEGQAYSAPSAADGGFSLDLAPGSYYLVARAPDPPFPGTDPGEGALFGYYGGNPLAVTVGQPAAVNLQVARRAAVGVTATGQGDAARIEGKVLGPRGPLAGASVYLYADASRNFRGPDLFGPQGAVPGGAGPDGSFSLEVPPGTYFLVASKRRDGMLGPLQPGDFHGYFDGNPLTVAAGTTTRVVVQAAEKLRETSAVPGASPGGAGIRGRIRDTDGKVPAGVYAYATTDPNFMIGAMPPHRSAVVGPDGAFLIELPAGGTYYVSARSGYGGPPLPGEWHGFHGEGKPAPVAVGSDRLTEGIDVVVRKME